MKCNLLKSLYPDIGITAYGLVQIAACVNKEITGTGNKHVFLFYVKVFWIEECELFMTKTKHTTNSADYKYYFWILIFISCNHVLLPVVLQYHTLKIQCDTDSFLSKT